MGQLPSSASRKFNPSDYKTSPDWFQGRFLSQLNLFTDPVYTALLNGLTFQQNFNAQIYVLNITANASFALNTASFQVGIQGQPVGMILINKNFNGNLTAPLISPIDYSWYFSNGSIFITGISGLVPGINYNLTFLVF